MESRHRIRYLSFEGAGQPMSLVSLTQPPQAPELPVVQITCCTICGSDLHTYLGRRNEETPSILGHEIVGRLVSPGQGQLRDITGRHLRVGDRITWSVSASCGSCDRCSRGMEQKCRQLFKYGHANSDRHPLSGGLATHCLIRPGTTIMRLPDVLPDSVAAPASCATSTVAAAVREAGTLKDMKVLIFGAGLLGLTACAFADAASAKEVHLCDVDSERLKRGSEFGATQLLSSIKDDDYDCVLEISGHPDAVSSAICSAGIGGRIVLVGSVSPGASVSVDPERVVRRLLSIRGVHNYRPQDLETAVRFLADNHDRYPFSQIVGKKFTLEQAESAMKFAADTSPVRVAVQPDHQCRSVEQIVSLFHRNGSSEYGGESVTQLEHALQTAWQAEKEDASSELIASALVHDVGHLLHDLPDDAPDEGIDDAHEELGLQFLKQYFGPAVCQPVLMHVAAKRYLCATDADYLQHLSPPSRVSLELQGGPMSPSEVANFEARPWNEEAVRLRVWDDIAKVPGLKTPSIEHFIPYLESASWNPS